MGLYDILKAYRESHTSWTIFTLKLCEMVLCGVCLYYHIEAVMFKDEPMPHNILFCSSFGGFFILSLSGVLVPASGQVTPPGVDLVFCMCAFVLFYTSALVPMYYVAIDEHLKYNTHEEEKRHPFFINCRTHCIMSFITATFYLMHASFSADRLLTLKMGLSEEEADKEEQKPDTISYNMSGMPDVDIHSGTPITLYLFCFDWLIPLLDKKWIKWVANTICCGCQCCNRPAQSPRAMKGKKSELRISPHQRAALRARIEEERKKRMTKKLEIIVTKGDGQMAKIRPPTGVPKAKTHHSKSTTSKEKKEDEAKTHHPKSAGTSPPLPTTTSKEKKEDEV